MDVASEISYRVEDELPFLDPVIAKWFNRNYTGLTEPQKRAIPLIHGKISVLVSSPTGTGKTMTGFLSILNELFLMSREGTLEDKIYCLYISPLKALANDIDKNLKRPLSEIAQISKESNNSFPAIRVSVRSGDTPQSERQKMLKKPPHILITTPESFSLALSAPKFREKFLGLKYVIVDEIHEVSATKRGSLLSINLERLENIAGHFVRIGLSATQAPLNVIGQFLCGYSNGEPRSFEIVDVDTKKSLDLSTITPVKDLSRANYEVANDKMYDVLAGLISEHRTTLVFTNTRSGTEHVALRLKARGIESIEAHHSSLGRETRLDVENKLKNGELKCVITSTSLELGIDIGNIDLVVQIGSPKSVSKGLQRIGRSGHGLNQLSKGRFLVFDLDDLMECAVLTKAAYDREIDRVVIPENPLDVLSQVLVGMSLEKVWGFDEAYDLIRKSYTFHTLEIEDYRSTINYLSGEIEDSTIYSKIWFDRDKNTFGKKKSSRMIYFMNVGTIPEEADYQVVNERGKHLGQLSDKFVERLKHGDVFVLGAKTYMYIRSTGNRVSVKDAVGMRPTVPSWTGEMLPRNYDLGVLVGEFREELYRRIRDREETVHWLMEYYKLDEYGANSLISYVKTQSQFALPTDRKLLVEGYIDSKNLYSIIFHIPLGRRINDALSRAYAQAISNQYSVTTRITVTDDGFMLTAPQKIPLKEQLTLINASNFEDMVSRSIINTEVFKQRFRHCAARSLMVLRKYKGYDISIVRQQLRSDKVLRSLESIKNFPVIKETYHEIMNDMMDVPRALNYVKDVIDRGNVSILDYREDTSPFSYGIILTGVSDIVLMEDRSKLLKELQSKIIDRVFGEQKISFMFNDSKVVENYFRSKVPRIRDEESYAALADHFLYIDPFRDRFNSPFPYSDIDPNEITERLINNGVISSVYIRSSAWASRTSYGILRRLFARKLEMNHTRKKLVELCDGSTFNELKSRSGMNEIELKDELIRLESAFLIGRKLRGGIVEYYSTPFATKPWTEDDVQYCLKKILGSYGPLTLDEIQIRLPFESQDLEGVLKNMVSGGEVVLDYISPVFSKQYIMKEDLDALVGESKRDIQSERIKRFSEPVDTLKKFFEVYGFAVDTWDIRARYPGFTLRELREALSSGEIVYGKFIKHRSTYMSMGLASTLNYLRYDRISKEESEILSYIGEGYDSDRAIVKRSAYDIKIIRQIIRVLEYKLAICRDENDNLRVLFGDKRSAGDIRFLVNLYGPVTLGELSRTFWFHGDEEIKASGLKPFYYNRELYYGDQNVTGPKGNSILLTILDPISMYMGKLYTRDIEFNSRLFSNGTEIADVQYEMKDNVLWIESVQEIPGTDYVQILTSLEQIRKRIGLDALVLYDEKKSFPDRLEDHGFKRTGDIVINLEAESQGMGEESLLKAAVSQFSRARPSEAILFNFLRDRVIGIRSEIEASSMGITNNQLRNYFQSRLLYTFNGPFGVPALGALETISLFRALKNHKLTDDEDRIVSVILDNSGATEEEILQTVRRNIPGIRAVIKSLYSNDVLAKDYNRKYVFVPEKYTQREAVDIILDFLLNELLFFDKDKFESVTGSEAGKDYHEAVDKLLLGKKVRKVINADEKRVSYVSTKYKPEKRIPSGTTIIMGPKDILPLYFAALIKRKFSVRNYFYLYSGDFVSAFTGKKRGKIIEVTKIIGDKKYREIIRREMNRMGFALTFR
ncbi:MAG: ATP-dependent helicase [Thermoplasmataceae archaeon]